MKITYENEYGKFSVEREDKSITTWMELVAHFRNILRGAGFVIDYDGNDEY